MRVKGARKIQPVLIGAKEPESGGPDSRLLPVLPVRQTVLFPLAIQPLNVGREKSIQLLNDVMAGDRTVAVVCQKGNPALPREKRLP